MLTHFLIEESFTLIDDVKLLFLMALLIFFISMLFVNIKLRVIFVFVSLLNCLVYLLDERHKVWTKSKETQTEFILENRGPFSQQF